MTALAILDAARRSGLSLCATPAGKIGVEPVSRLTPELRASIVENRDAILALLSSPCAFFWGHRPAEACARCGNDYRSHLWSAGIFRETFPPELEEAEG